jgi:predicted nucleic acid-binding protein
VPRGRRFTVDTNLYIDALRTSEGKAGLGAFHSAYAPFAYLSAVVAHELRAGVRGRAAARLEKAVLAPFERRGRVFAPTYSTWKSAAGVLSDMVGPRGWEGVSRAFVNDVLLAMSCREQGIVLVTRNVSDFTRIAAVQKFEFIAPWPVPGA